MSAYFSFSVALALRSDLPKKDSDLLNYLVNGHGTPPAELPAHRHFSERKSVASLMHRYAASMPNGRFVCRYWAAPDRAGGSAASGVTLLLPSIKAPQHWDMLELLDWMASLSAKEGFVGTMVDDFPKQALTLLWVFEGRLFFGSAQDVQVAALHTGEKRTVGY